MCTIKKNLSKEVKDDPDSAMITTVMPRVKMHAALLQKLEEETHAHATAQKSGRK